MMQALYEILLAPFVEDQAMRLVLAATAMLALASCPVGVFLMLRRMSLTGDAMSHAILPGVAAGFFLFGMDVVPMTLGGLLAGLAVALAAGAVARLTVQREDAALAAFYLISLASGVLLVTLRGSDEELVHVLFGSLEDLDGQGLALIAAMSLLGLATLALFRRALLAESLDPLFFRSVSRLGPTVHFVFMALVVTMLVAGFRALGTLLAVGIMMLPAAAARFWTASVAAMCLLAVAIGMTAAACGLLLAHHFALPPGPAIVLSAGGAYLVSMLFGPRGAVGSRAARHQHRTA